MRVKLSAMPVRLFGMAIFAISSVIALGAVNVPVAAMATDGGAIHITVNKDRELLDGDYVLDTDIDGQIVVKAGQDVTLDLNGHNITTDGKHAIVVEDKASLVVNGNGKVEARGKNYASLVNSGTTVINGGHFYKDEGCTSDAVGESGYCEGNSPTQYYAIDNSGNMTINMATVEMANYLRSSHGASLIRNGYGTNGNAIITIENGKFIGGTVNLKNDEGGEAYVNGGEFIEGANGVIQNWNVMSINGGSFVARDDMKRGIINLGYDASCANPTKGEITIADGVFSGKYLLDEYAERYQIHIKPVITGGTFNVEALYSPVESWSDEIKSPVITGGLFTDDSIELPALPAGYYRYTVKGGATLVTDEAVDFKGGDFVVNLTVGDSYLLDLPQLVLDNATISLENLDGVIDRLDNEILTVHPGISLVKVEFNNQVQTYVINIADVVDDNQDDTDAPSVTDPVEKAPVDEADIVAPNTGITTPASDSIGGTSALATITTALAMLVVLAGIRIAAKEND